MNNEIVEATVDNDPSSLMGLSQNKGRVMSSFDLSTDEGQTETLQYLQDNELLADHVGEIIRIKDVVAHKVTIVDDKTGDVSDGMRTIIIDDKGKAYAATSQGVTNSLAQIFSIKGEPQTWKKPVSVKVAQKRSRTNAMYHVLTLIPVLDNPGKK